MNTFTSDIIIFLFVVGFLWDIKLMNSPKTAVKGNLLGALSMLGAIIVTLISKGIIAHSVVWTSIAAGGIIGYFLAMKVAMIQMPQFVALLNGLGGGASAITALVVLNNISSPVMTNFTGGLALVVGGVTFSGSLIAVEKLDQKITQKPIILHGHTFLSVLTVTLLAIFIVLITLASKSMIGLISIITLAFSLFLGLIFTIRIGGADMPITISLLNSFSGLAGSIVGFTIYNPLLVAVGAIVGSAGIILTRIMCHAMNRSLWEVLMGKTTVSFTKPIMLPGNEEVSEDAGVNKLSVIEEKDNRYEMIISFLRDAKKVVIAPGYGMAISQAQSKVKELFEKLEQQGKEVKFAIHPVAGRMPGHMNVLLAEVDIPYDKLYDIYDINPMLKDTDVVIVVGANDVVNPAAATAKGTPIYGMPILKVNEAVRIIICNLDAKPGYAGVPNPLYEQENVTLLLGDAAETVGKLVEKVG